MRLRLSDSRAIFPHFYSFDKPDKAPVWLGADNHESPSVNAGTLFIVATPIGNLADITLRALEILRSVQCIAAEDTRHTRKLLSYYDIHKPLISHQSNNAKDVVPKLIARLLEGEDIAVVTDAGVPGISDPGAFLVHDAIEAGVDVVGIPGANAATTALVISGLPTHPFAFLGFPPNRGAGRRRFFEAYAHLPMTLVLYESPQRIRDTLNDIETYWGNRNVALARELTKIHEEVSRGRVSEVRNRLPDEVRGELTLVVAGADENAAQAAEREGERDWRKDLESLLMEDGLTLKDAVDRVAQERRIPRREVYQAALAMKKERQ